MNQCSRIVKTIRTAGVLCLPARRMTRIPGFLLAVAVAALMVGSACAETWSGAAAPNLSWGTGVNWGGSAPANPAASLITFTNAGASTVNGTITSVLDASRQLNAGLTFSNTNGNYHVTDLGGNTLTLNGGELRVGYNVKGSSATFQNGTLKIGDASAASLNVGYGSSSATLTINSDFSANLGTVTIGSANFITSGGGTLDLRNAVLSQSAAFACDSLTIGQNGTGSTPGVGHVYLDDGGRKITALQVQTLGFYSGTLTLNAGASVTIGSSINRGSLVVGYGVPATATLTPTGAFSAYLTTLIVGEANYTAGASGTLDLRGATLQALDVSGLVTIGSSRFSYIPGVGQVYLPAGSAYFGGLSMGVNTDPGNNNLLQLKGTTLTIGNSNTNVFSIGAAKGNLVLDFSNTDTHLKVYGNWQSSGPATNLPTYLADGRLTYLPTAVTNKVAMTYDGTYTHVKWADPKGTIVVIE